MRHAVAALVVARTVASREGALNQTPAPAGECPVAATAGRRRRWWSVVPLSVWKATHPGS